MRGDPVPVLGRLAPALRVLLVVFAAAAGWWLAGSSGARPLAALGGALAACLAIGVELGLRQVQPRRILGGLAGLAAGWLLVGLLPWEALPAGTGGLLTLLLLLAFGWVGLVTGARELSRLRWPATAAAAPPRPTESPVAAGPGAKVVDTSVIIDGRIDDVVRSGFIEGVLLVPQFVIRELQHVADSSDPLKRARGRQGLDVLKELQESDRVAVELVDRDFSDIEEVDGKLLALAEEAGAKVLTNDYNLNKVAQLRGVSVLNVNDLANAVKPVVLPGESLSVQVIKEGKERNQGVGYLDDGTMIVVDNARDQLGERLEVLVTSVIQTNAGKMIFASPDEEAAAQRPRVVRRDRSPAGGEKDTGPGVGPPT